MPGSGLQDLRPRRHFEFREAWFYWETASRAVSVFSALLSPTVETCSCNSLSCLYRISHISYVKMDIGRLSWTLFSLVSGSHLSVSVSPEEYRMSGFFWEITSAQFASPIQMLGSTVVYTGVSYGGCSDVFHKVFYAKVRLGSCVGSLLRAARLRQPLPGVSVTGGALHFFLLGDGFQVLLRVLYDWFDSRYKC